jgi:predicted DNA-binding transcriptional regulator AlpA
MEKEPFALAAEDVRAIAEHIAQHLTRFPRHASPWLTPEEAAAYLCLKRRGLEDMRTRGTGPKFHKVNDRVVRYHVRDLDAWLLSKGGGDE